MLVGVDGVWCRVGGVKYWMREREVTLCMNTIYSRFVLLVMLSVL